MPVRYAEHDCKISKSGDGVVKERNRGSGWVSADLAFFASFFLAMQKNEGPAGEANVKRCLTSISSSTKSIKVLLSFSHIKNFSDI